MVFYLTDAIHISLEVTENPPSARDQFMEPFRGTNNDEELDQAQ